MQPTVGFKCLEHNWKPYQGDNNEGSHCTIHPAIVTAQLSYKHTNDHLYRVYDSKM